ncbi:MAG TPA: biopolymer transporter ExbD [Sulfurospirillum sp. UBA11407]|nr:MAG TPA: biopolymer transporter ExbD [Sulfurospirillum sp. UBA11407]
MKRREYISPDITPLIDIVFLLLIFFLVSSVFKKEENHLQINLPQTKGEKIIKKDEMIKLSLKEEKLFINDKKLEVPLELFLQNYQKNLAIHIYIDKQTTYETILPLLTKISQLGFENLHLMGMQN